MFVLNTDQKPKRPTIDNDAVSYLLAFFKYSFIAAYFIVWHRKAKIRDRIRLGSWAVISLSTILLLAKVLIESESVRTLISSSTVIPIPHLPIVMVVPFVLYLLYHDIKESQKPAHEYRFVKQVGQFMLGRPSTLAAAVAPTAAAGDIEEAIKRAMKNLPKLFEAKKSDWLLRKLNLSSQNGRMYRLLTKFHIAKRSGFDCCSFYVLNHTALGIEPYYFSRELNDQNYLFVLREGEGVAGRVVKDGVVRYVPRLFFPFCRRRKWSPFLFFPHAVTFGVAEKDGLLELYSEGLDCFAFTPPTQGNLRFRSVVSVPVKSVNQVFGVMNFDFCRYDPLDKSEIAMCSALGLLLGDEIGRLRPLPS